MQRIAVLLAAAVMASAPTAYAQSVIPRETRVGGSRTVELIPVTAHAAQPNLARAPFVGAVKANVEQVQAAPKAKEDDKIRDAVNEQMAQVETAIRALNPSYAIAPVIGAHAATAGSFYIRVPAPAGDGADAKKAVRVQLPPPLIVGSRSARRDGPQMRVWPPPLWPSSCWPSWLYAGTIQVEGVRPMRAVGVAESELNELRHEIRRLQEAVDKLNKGTPPK